jgi:hypothetical protein
MGFDARESTPGLKRQLVFLNAKHKPQKIHRTLIARMKNSTEFGKQMSSEAKRRRFGEAKRKAFVGDGLACNWTIHAERFEEHVPILDFVHAVRYLYTAALICLGKTELAWTTDTSWMQGTWEGKIADGLTELRSHQSRMGLPPVGAREDDPREPLRQTIGSWENNRSRMQYDA